MTDTRPRPEHSTPGIDRGPRDAAPVAAPPSGPVVRPAPELRFAGVALVALVLLVTTYVLFAGTELGQRLENAALRGAEFRSEAEREASLARLSQISVAIFVLAIGAVFWVGLLRRRGGLGSLVAGVMVVSVVAAELIKDVLPRPELVAGPAWILRNSFPSGSAAVATAIAIGTFLVAPDRLRWAVLPIGAIYAAVIGEAIQATGWHRLSDTIGSTLLVIAVAGGGLVLLSGANLVQPSAHGHVDRRIRDGLTVLALVAFGLGTVPLLLVTIFPLLATPEGARRVFLQSAFPLFGAGFTILALMLFARVVEPFSLGRARPTSDARPLSATGSEPRTADWTRGQGSG